MEAPIIYNLFPRLAGTLDRWGEHARRAKSMGFNWIFLNPVSQPGFSGSLYSVSDHYKVCPDFLPRGSSKDGVKELSHTLQDFNDIGLSPIMDLVINHTAIDSPLVSEHPEWFKKNELGKIVNPSAVDPADTRRVTVWGDLAEVDNEQSPDLDSLWDYWRKLVRFSIELGFKGFRCDAAYKVPAVLWRLLVDEAREMDPDIKFFAETLGCEFNQVMAMKPSGLDYLFNSSKYWNFDQPWALEQHKRFGIIAPSISFPESHDTPRLMSDTGGNEAVQRQRYMLAAVFSKGLMMPVGYEFGFKRRLHVVETRPEDWEEPAADLRSFISSVNALKLELGPLGTEGDLRALTPYDLPTIILEKTSEAQKVIILVNKDWNNPQGLDSKKFERCAVADLIRLQPDGEVIRSSVPSWIQLQPAEIALIA